MPDTETLSVPPPAPLRLELFGAPRVIFADGKLAAFEADSAMTLFAYLALHPGQAFSRNTLAARLYPEQDNKQAMQNFRQALFRLRRAIHNDEAEPPFLLLLQETVEFNPAASFTLDTIEFEIGIAATHKHPHRRVEACSTCIQQLARLIEVYRGDLLVGLTAYEDHVGDWLRIQREHYRELACGALHTLIAYHQARQNHDAVIQYCERLWQIDSLDEIALRAQMQELAHNGQRNRALVLYRDFELRLQDELAVEPETETVQLVKQLRGNAPPPPVAPKQRARTLLTAQMISHHELPNTRMPFIHRTREMQTIGAHLAERDCRLITLTGPCGIGKTRLALRAASEDTVGWKNGVWLATFGETTTQTPLRVIARALGVSVPAGGNAAAELYQFLRASEILLMLDNVECAPDATEWLAGLLEHTAGLQIIATAPEPLGLRGEINLRIEGLAYPRAGETDFAQWREKFPAMALFAEHAARAQPALEWHAENLAHVARICEMVQGVPLALEIAAAWTRSLSPEKITDVLQENPRALDQPRADVPPRQSTLGQAFEYVWRRLTPTQQTQYAKLVAFPGAIAAAHAQSAADITPTELAALYDKSMLYAAGPDCFKVYAAHRLFMPPGIRVPAAGA